MTKFYKATAADGRVYTRLSTSERAYLHAILNAKHKPSFSATCILANNIAGPGDEIVSAVEIDAAEYRALNRKPAEAPAKKGKPATAKKAGDPGPAALAKLLPPVKAKKEPIGRARKAARLAAEAKKAARKNKVAPAAAQRPATGKRATILAAAEAGKLPQAPDFSAKTHERFRGKLAAVIALVEAGDLAGLKAFTINPYSSSPRAIDRYRNLAVVALESRGR